MNFYKDNQNAAILKIMKISQNCHVVFTANLPNVPFKSFNS